ncbi:hypothetical protein L0665_06045 [Methanogenium marinum]|uniref:Uncharacterized protein n=1 Tax=Methanogenium marinum TaxID=348610 RepID=A0A9Q4PW15_9EURY|nr:hypothetical protein [Methanogenium marinum]MDE4908169.1 hypothetical protein [Methanogenium marinum]
MTETWRELLYPAEWGFRFIIAALLIALVFRFSSVEAVVGFWILIAGCAVCLLLQVRVTILAMWGKIRIPGA